MEEVPSVQVGRLALALQCLLGSPSKDRDMCCSAAESCFRKLTEDCLADCCQTGQRRGLLNFMGGGKRRLSQRGDELLLNSEELNPFKHIRHDAIIHNRQKKMWKAFFNLPTSAVIPTRWATSKTTSDKTRGRLQTEVGGSGGRALQIVPECTLRTIISCY